MKLATRYEIVEPSGEGGFAKVIHARDKWLERDIAVKILDPLIAKSSEDEIKRFLQEARILAKLSHPNIPSIYDIFFEVADQSEDGKARFQIIFEYVQGQNLHQYLQENGPATLDRARLWFVQLASALGHAHNHNVVHRDLKPKNIIIREDLESACLVDFGIALTKDEAERFTKFGYIVGTEGYMSPEQIAGEELDRRTDVYNLGLCLYETLAGTPLPHGEYKLLSALNEVIPSSIDDLIRACLDHRDRRLPNAQAFASDLQHALRPPTSLASVIADGTLAELNSALEDMTPTEFCDRPAGQRMVIIEKVRNISELDNPKLEYPTVSLLERIIQLGVRLQTDEYRQIQEIALVWAFDHEYHAGGIGEERLRKVLAKVAKSLPPGNFEMMAEMVDKSLRGRDLTLLKSGHLNGWREVLTSLMANRACEDMAPRLAVLLRKINDEHKGRSFPPSMVTGKLPGGE